MDVGLVLVSSAELGTARRRSTEHLHNLFQAFALSEWQIRVIANYFKLESIDLGILKYHYPQNLIVREETFLSGLTGTAF